MDCAVLIALTPPTPSLERHGTLQRGHRQLPDPCICAARVNPCWSLGWFTAMTTTVRPYPDGPISIAPLSGYGRKFAVYIGFART